MRIRAAFLLPLLVTLLVFSPGWALDDLDDDDSSSTKLSTVLLVGSDAKNQTENYPSRSNTMKMLEIPKIRGSSIHEKKTMDFMTSLPGNSSNIFLDKIDKIFDGVNRENSSSDDDLDESEDLSELLPEALELRSSRIGNRRNHYYRLSSRPPSSNRRNVFPVEAPLRSSKRPSRRPAEIIKREPTEEDCTFFTKTVCLETANYPHEAIMRSIRGNKEMISALLTDYNGQDSENDYRKSLPLDSVRFENNGFGNKYENNEIKRRSDYGPTGDNVEEGFTCPSQIMYARPQLARAVSGSWKYIINTGEHTQTLRLEKCSKPRTSCSFISENYRSSCTQVYNYHRLLTWESSVGLHMDIFKVPSCCSCHVHGYAELYPPIQKDPPRSPEENFPGAEFSTDQNNDGTFERPTSYLTKYKPTSSFDNNFVGGGGKPILDSSSVNRPSFSLPGRGRPKKPSSGNRPFDKLPQQHAPNTRAPGYKGPVVKKVRPIRNNRPYRRESNSELEETVSTSTPSTLNNWFQSFDQESDASAKLQNGGFDEEYQEPNIRVNYDYHPIIDFFKPEASALTSQVSPAGESSPPAASSSSSSANDNAWKPMIAP